MLMSDTCFLTLTNNLSEIEQLTNELGRFLIKCKASADDKHAVTLALEEWFANVVNHSFKDDLQHLIKIKIEFQKPILRIKVIDDGIAFDPVGHQLPDLFKPLEERQIGGVGMHLIHKLIDDVSYFRENDTNIIVLEKKLH